jgi:2-methylcitrate dehydratase PrpD
LDCLGVALAAVEEPVVQKLTRLLKTQGGKKEAWVWGQGSSLPLLSAVLINGTMGHALDFDDSAFSHPTSTLLPVVVALGEKFDLSGQEVLAAS